MTKKHPSWRCGHCHVVMKGTFPRCWKCGSEWNQCNDTSFVPPEYKQAYDQQTGHQVPWMGHHGNHKAVAREVHALEAKGNPSVARRKEAINIKAKALAKDRNRYPYHLWCLWWCLILNIWWQPPCSSQWCQPRCNRLWWTRGRARGSPTCGNGSSTATHAGHIGDASIDRSSSILELSHAYDAVSCGTGGANSSGPTGRCCQGGKSTEEFESPAEGVEKRRGHFVPQPSVDGARNEKARREEQYERTPFSCPGIGRCKRRATGGGKTPESNCCRNGSISCNSLLSNGRNLPWTSRHQIQPTRPVSTQHA